MKTHPLTPRLAAVEILARILDKQRPLDEVLEANANLATCEGRDRGFVRLLVSTTLRRLGQIDQLIDQCLSSPLQNRARMTRYILRIGICQLIYLKTPPHAAVDTSVRLAQQMGQGAYKKLINAILRRVDREGEQMMSEQDPARLNTPDWLWESWQAHYGDDVCRQIATAHMIEAPLDISCKSNPEHWVEQLGGELLVNGSIRLTEGGNVTELPGFEQGAWWVQDAAATRPVKMLGDVTGKQVIDLCAAPGGKTAQLAAAGARVTAVDRSANRLIRLEQNLTRLNLSADVITDDAVNWRPKELADMVLLDAPCSATGTIRRHPDLPYLKAQKDVTRLANLQGDLLKASIEMVKPGGLILFCTCSLQPEEGENHFKNISGTLPSLELIKTEQSLPHQMQDIGGNDGFHMTLLKKR